MLFGKPLSLRRLLPVVRVDYVRIAGTKWTEDSEQQFVTTLDFRDSLLRLIPKLEATILDDLPHHFRLEEGSTQRKDQPLLPQKVIREAVVNAVMHRDYHVNQPILIVRYSNRLEIRNAGYSLKSEIMLGDLGSKLRNPILAAVLYDINFAETKGSGIRRMRVLLEQAGLSAPFFNSNVLANQFQATYLLHQLLGEEHLTWLKQFTHLNLNSDEAKALILAKETGAVDNAGLRSATGLDTLSASQVLRRLHHQYNLLAKGGAGSSTYYQLTSPQELPLFSEDYSNTGDLKPAQMGWPAGLMEMIDALSPKARKDKLWPAIVWLCALKPFKAEGLASLLGKQINHLRGKHLNKIREEEKLIQYILLSGIYQIARKMSSF